MSKKRSKNNVERILNVEALEVMLDEELRSLAECFERDRIDAIQSGVYARSFEEDIAYIRREQQIRSARREATNAYRDAEYTAQFRETDETFLPMFDDRCNHSYVNAARRR